jgi:DNA processing protein
MSSIRSWIALDVMPEMGPRTVQRLLARFGSPEGAFAAAEAELRSAGFLKQGQIRNILDGPDERRVEEVLAVLDDAGAWAVPAGDPSYPACLRELEDPPTVLYVMGSLDEIQPAVAVVGTRSPSMYGRRTAFHLARDLSLQGVSIVSGLARGIDQEAHRGALEGLAGTIAVLGSGIDVIYPPEHADLAGRIAGKGALLTEFPPGTKPDARNFPRRNRIISGLAGAVIVVEASMRSGAMITARLAVEQNRTVMAVPGNVTNVRSQGPHHLIRQGALLVETASDVIAEIAPSIAGALMGLKDLKETKAPSDEILTMAASGPVTIDEIALSLDLDVAEAARRVSALELSGRLERISPNRYVARDTNG